MARKPTSLKPVDPETTGHEWDGIEELNNPLPRWWLWTFYATIAWAVVYTVLYPAWPMLSDNTRGLLGYSSRADVAVELDQLGKQRNMMAAGDGWPAGASAFTQEPSLTARGFTRSSNGGALSPELSRTSERR